MGGGGGGDNTSTSTVYTNADPWKGVQPYLANLYSATNSAGQNPAQFYPGQTYTNMDALTKQGIESNLGYASNYFPTMYNQGVQGMYGLMNSMDVGNNPYVQDMNQVAANQFTRASNQAIGGMVSDFNNNVLPGITTDALRSGNFGSSRQGVAQGMALNSLNNSVRDIIQSGQSDLANMYAQTNLGAYGQGLGATNQAIAQLPQMAQLGLLPGQVFQQAGGLFEGQQQKAIDDRMARWDFAQNEPWQRLSNMNAIFSGASPYAAQSSSTKSSAPAPVSNPWATAAAGATALGAFF